MALAPKKSVALQLRRQSLAGVAPVSGGSDTTVTVSLAGWTLPTMAPVPSAGRADAGAQRVPSEVVEQPVMVVILLPMMGWTELPITLVALTMAGATKPVVTPQCRWRWRRS